MRFDDVSFSYGEVPVLDGARFHIHAGEFAALVGPNGAGKTTVLKLLLGLARPSAGRVSVLGLPPEEARRSIGYVPQHVSYDPAFPISVAEVVRMGRLHSSTRRYGRDDERAVLNALAMADVSELAGRPYSALSGGQRRRVLVARALAAEPELLVLDEPTANMDAESEARLFETLGGLKGEATILVVTHDTGFVTALTDSVFCVGERGHGRSVIRHLATPASHVASDQYGGPALQVLHDTELPDDGCCGGKAGL
ncbi:MAG: ABC transporter ATP-binding protein [Spirochaetes bacterium]|nr:ABC transporter ATP-binding protein [Spirochaetota bacterium]MBU1079087.1 ABC transporter ATP-binding protein [Spirochaetota bacterium]